MITLAQAKEQCRVRHSDEDTYIGDLITRAQAWVERYTAKPIAVATVTDTFTGFGDYLLLSRGPFVTLTSIGYIDADGVEQTLADTRVRDGRIYAPTAGWPTIEDYSTVTVTYTAGFATTPPEIDQTMLLLIGHWYRNREAVVVGSITKEIEYAIEALAGPFRLPTVA